MALFSLACNLYQGNPDMVNLLLEHGATYWRRDRIGMTPLHYAAYAGHIAVVDILARRLALPGKPGVDFSREVYTGKSQRGTSKMGMLLQALTRSRVSVSSRVRLGGGSRHDPVVQCMLIPHCATVTCSCPAAVFARQP